MDFRISFAAQAMDPKRKELSGMLRSKKISGLFKIPGTAENFAVLRSIIDTAIKNNQNVAGALSVIAAYKRY